MKASLASVIISWLIATIALATALWREYAYCPGNFDCGFGGPPPNTTIEKLISGIFVVLGIYFTVKHLRKRNR